MRKEKRKVEFVRIDHIIILHFPNTVISQAFLRDLILEVNVNSLTRFKNYRMEKGIRNVKMRKGS